MQTRRVLPQQHDRLCAAALQGGAGMARQNLWDTNIRIIEKAIGGHRLAPTMTGRWNTTDRPGAQPVSQLGEALRMPGLVPLARR